MRWGDGASCLGMVIILWMARLWRRNHFIWWSMANVAVQSPLLSLTHAYLLSRVLVKVLREKFYTFFCSPSIWTSCCYDNKYKYQQMKHQRVDNTRNIFRLLPNPLFTVAVGCVALFLLSMDSNSAQTNTHFTTGDRLELESCSRLCVHEQAFTPRGALWLQH